MKYILFSDVHCDKASCELIVQKTEGADIAIGAGDFAFFRKNLKKSISFLSRIKIPTVLVPGNHESHAELMEACQGLNNFYVLHGNIVEIYGVTFVGIGCAIPMTPFISWSVDLSEENAEKLLSKPDKEFVFITHSPPFGCLDEMHNKQSIGSKTIRTFIENSRPSFVVCGHIHERWNQQDHINGIPVINAGPKGYEFTT